MKLFELRAVTAAVESSGQTKAEAQVSHLIIFHVLVFSLCTVFFFFSVFCSEFLAVFSFVVF